MATTPEVVGAQALLGPQKVDQVAAVIACMYMHAYNN